MTPSQLAFLSAFSALVLFIAAFLGLMVVHAWRGVGKPGRGGWLRALEMQPRSTAGLPRWGFYLHRFTGVAVFGFLLLHIVDVSLFAFSAALYNHVHQLYGNVVLRIFECGLVFAVLFHTLNGLRLLTVDAVDLGVTAARTSMVVILALVAVSGAAASYAILAPVL